MMKPTLVDNAGQCWRWFSMQAQAIAASIVAGWGIMPPEWRAAVPVWLLVVLVCTVLVLGMIGRVVKQAPPPNPPDPPAPPAGGEQ